MDRKLLFVPFTLFAASVLVGCKNDKEVNVTFSGSDKVVFNGSSTAIKGQTYKAKITYKDPEYFLDKGNFEIKVQNNPLTSSWYFINNELSIDGNAITGDVNITFSYVQHDIDVSYDLGEGLKVELLTPKQKNIPFKAVMTARERFRRPNSIEVKVAGEVLDKKDYSYSQETGAIEIEGKNVTGDIKITATAIEQVKITFSQYGYSKDEDKKVLISFDEKDPKDEYVYVDKKGTIGFDLNKATFKYAYDKFITGKNEPRSTGDDLKYKVNDQIEDKSTGQPLKHFDYLYFDEESKPKSGFFADIFEKDTTFYLSCSIQIFKISTNDTNVSVTPSTTTWHNEENELTLTLKVKEDIASTKALPNKETLEITSTRYGETKVIDPDNYSYNLNSDFTEATITLNPSDIEGDIKIKVSTISKYVCTFYDEDKTTVIGEPKLVTAGKTLLQVNETRPATPESKPGFIFDHWSLLQGASATEVIVDDNDILDDIKDDSGNHKYYAVYKEISIENDSWTSFLDTVSKDYEAAESGTNAQGDIFKAKYNLTSITDAIGKTRKVIIEQKGVKKSYNVCIIDVMKDKIAYTEKKALLTIEFSEPVVTTKYNDGSTSFAYYTSSIVYKKCEEIADSMAEIKNSIKSVIKWSRSTSWSSTVSSFICKLFTLSNKEYAGENRYLCEDEGVGDNHNQCYDYYNSNDYWEKCARRTKETICWTRTPRSSYGDEVFYISTNGEVYYSSTPNYYEYGVAPAFCL